MQGDSTTSAQKLRVSVSADRLSAWLVRPPGILQGADSAPTVESLRSLLVNANIAVDSAVEQRIADYVALFTPAGADDADAQAPREIPEKYLLAEGTPPTDGENGRFVWDERFQKIAAEWNEHAAIDYYSVNQIVTVPEGTVIGRLIAPTAGTPGVDLLGQPLKPRVLRGNELRLVGGLELCPYDATLVRTTAPGRIRETSETLELDEVLLVRGDVNFDSGSIDSCIDVDVAGTVKSHFTVRCSRSLTVGNTVEAAGIEVGGDLTVRGGIFGHERAGTIRAGGAVTAKFCDEADIEARGDVRLTRESLNSRIKTHEKLYAQHGAILGGEVQARCGIEAGVLGSDAGVTTLLTVGTDRAVLFRARQMEEEMRQRSRTAAQIREKVQPLMANIKRLTPAQREQATELLARADELEIANDDLQAQKETMLAEAAPPTPPFIRVEKQTFPGVRIGIELRDARIGSVIHGPVRFELRKVNGATEVVAVNQRTGSVTVLPSVEAEFSPAAQPQTGAAHAADTPDGPQATR